MDETMQGFQIMENAENKKISRSISTTDK